MSGSKLKTASLTGTVALLAGTVAGSLWIGGITLDEAEAVAAQHAKLSVLAEESQADAGELATLAESVELAVDARDLPAAIAGSDELAFRAAEHELQVGELVQGVHVLGLTLETVIGTDPPQEPEDPGTEDPVDPGGSDPGGTATYGVPADVELVDWTFNPVPGAGRPAGVAPPDSGETMEAFRFHASEHGESTDRGILSEHHVSYLDGLTIRDAVVESWNKWGARGHGIRSDVVLRRVTFRDGVQEHAWYVNVAGWAAAPELGAPEEGLALLIDECLFEDIPSQAVQIVYRGVHHGMQETPNPELDDSPGGWIVVEDSLLRNVGTPDGARASFALSFFRTKNPVRVSRVVLDNSMHATSRGALLAEAREVLIVEDSSFTTGELEQPMFQIQGVETVTIRGCAFEAAGGQDWITIEGASKVTVEGCTGATRLRIDGEDVGAVEDGFTLGALLQGPWGVLERAGAPLAA